MNGVPSFGDAAVPNQYLTKDAAINPPVALPTASGGDGALIYALSPALPDGVVASSASPFAISGTPTSYMNKTQYTWKATDADGDYAELTFHIRVVERVVIPPYTPPPEGTVDPMVIPAPLTFSGAITDKDVDSVSGDNPVHAADRHGRRGRDCLYARQGAARRRGLDDHARKPPQRLRNSERQNGENRLQVDCDGRRRH